MRILFTFAGGSGHFNPLIPIATALRTAGHTVAFLGHRTYASAIDQAGFPFLPTGKPSTDPPKHTPLQTPDLDHELEVVRTVFAGSFARRRVDELLATAPEWIPDIIVCDEMDFGAMLAAERLGIPHVSVIVIAAGGFATPAVIAEPLNQIRTEIGLPPDPDCVMPGRHLVLEPIPRGFRTPDDPLPPTAHRLRPTNPDPGSFSWEPPRNNRPNLYFTLGTIFNLESGDLFTRVLDGLHKTKFNTIVTVGHGFDLEKLGLGLTQVWPASYIPQELLLPHVDIVISHGGSGTVIGTLAQGLPQVLIPMGADQILNGLRCEALGIGIELNPMTLTPDDVVTAVTAVTLDPQYRENAESIRDETAKLPGPEHAVGLMEALNR